MDKVYKYITLSYVIVLTLSFFKGYCSIRPCPLYIQLVAPLIEIILCIILMNKKRIKVELSKIVNMSKQWISIIINSKTCKYSLFILLLLVIGLIIVKTIWKDITIDDIINLYSSCRDKIANSINGDEISKQVSDDFIDMVSSVAIGTIIGILTIALPIITNSMHTLADRYQTNYVLSLLNRDKALVAFRIIMVLSLIVSTAWIVCYFCASEKLCFIAIILFIFTLAFIISLIVLVARMVRYSMPDKLFIIVLDKLNDYSAPKNYFNRELLNKLHPWGSKEEEKRLRLLQENDKYDSKVTCLLVIVARIFAIFGSDTILRKAILQYWEQACRKASYIDNDGYKRYTAGYYNFIYELADWAISHNNTRLEEDTITFLNILLKAHIGKPKKLSEPQSEEHIKKYLISFETFECLWKIMRQSVDCSNEDMFKKYWQIVNNFFSIKYKDIIQYKINEDIKAREESERNIYLIVHYLCCSYLMGRKKYILVEYVLHYSQQSKFEWYLIPNNASEIITTYCYVKDWYADWDHQIYFSFTEDYNLFAEEIINNPIAQFTSLLLLLFGEKASQLKDLKIEKTYHSYIHQLHYSLSNINKETDWVKEFRLEEALKYKEDILSVIGSFLDQPPQAAPFIRFTRNTDKETAIKGNCLEQLISSIAGNMWSWIVKWINVSK